MAVKLARGSSISRASAANKARIGIANDLADVAIAASRHPLELRQRFALMGQRLNR